MQPFERMVGTNGYEVALFHMPQLYMTQDEGGDFSHQGTYNIDFLGYTVSGYQAGAPLYAPTTMKVVATRMFYSGGNTVVFESTNMVNLANGYVDHLTIFFSHDANPPIAIIGASVNQGQICYHTGTYGYVTGDHVHTCCGQGTYQGFTTRPTGHEDLTNRIHYWDALYVNDTTILQGFGHNWRIYQGGTPPTPPITHYARGKFPWVLYAKKLRTLRES